MDSSLTCAHLRGLSKSYLTSFVSDKLASFAKNIPQCETCKIPMQGVWMCLETNCGYSACERDFSSHAKMRQTENAVHGLSISSDTGVIRCQTCAQDICINSLDAPEDIYPIIETLYLLRRKVWKKFDPRSVAKIDSLILPTTRPRGVCGLKNIGNTCFMNASLQALFACQYFSQYFRKGFTSDGIAKKVVLSEAFLSVINDIWAHEKTVVTPSSIFRQVVEINPYFDGYQQQDAQEFIRCVLDRLNDEIGEVHLSKSSTVSNDLKSLGEKEDAPSSSTPPLAHTPTVSMISDLFEGEFQTHLSCRGCGQKSIRKEHFHDISIGIAAASSRSSTTSPGGEKKPKGIISSLLSSFKGKHRSPSLFSSGVSLADCFAEFVKEEYLTEDKLTCDHCKKPNEFIKQTFISKLPQVVCVHLKRFQYKGNSGFKVATLVQFSQELNTTTCLPPQLTPEERESLERKYDLKAIICHRGGYNGGHYIAFAKTKHGQWFRYDDDRVERSSLSEVLKQEAYMLFYENARPQQEVLHIRSLIRTNVCLLIHGDRTCPIHPVFMIEMVLVFLVELGDRKAILYLKRMVCEVEILSESRTNYQWRLCLCARQVTSARCPNFKVSQNTRICVASFPTALWRGPRGDKDRRVFGMQDNQG
eukprot:TRINITY_DN2255_c0_g3_i1.p1 TRINITY_DN2255_c0_g3~~TRINITY_DN2255_c0_g3_i1.p1  ORF type:complete len:645 (-),score=85.40 TRINITY_DN2255_c0_g3_i1:738-2672(-)